MKVLHVIPSISPLRGGPSQAVIEMVSSLRDQGIDARVVCTQDNGNYRNPDLATNRWIIYRNVPIMLHECIDSEYRSIKEYLISVSFVRWLLMNIHEYDLVHVHAIFSFPSTVAMLIARFKNIPYIVRTIGQLNPWSLQQGFLKKKLMLELIERGNLKQAHAVHVTSEYERNDLELLGLRKNCFVLGLGVDSVTLEREEIHLNRCEKKVKFLYLSRIHPKKQMELLLQSLNFLSYTLNEKNWELLVAGSGETSYVNKLRENVKALGLEENITWHGHVSGDEKQKLLTISDWFVLTSASENFGISTVEAMAASIPVIVTETIGVSDKVLKYNAGYVCKEDIEMIAMALKEAINGSGFLEMSIGARKLVDENFSWEHIGQSLASFYRGIDLTDSSK